MDTGKSCGGSLIRWARGCMAQVVIHVSDLLASPHFHDKCHFTFSYIRANQALGHRLCFGYCEGGVEEFCVHLVEHVRSPQ